MNIQFQFKGIQQTKAIREQVEKKVKKIQRLTQNKGSLKIKISIFKKKYCAHVCLRVNGYHMESRRFGSFLYTAVRSSIEKVHSQLKRRIQMKKLDIVVEEINPSLDRVLLQREKRVPMALPPVFQRQFFIQEKEMESFFYNKREDEEAKEVSSTTNTKEAEQQVKKAA